MNQIAASRVDKTMRENDIIKLDQLADLMDNKFVIPGTDMRVGLDAIIGLVPGIGDTISMAISGYIIHKARQHGAGPVLLSRMSYNVFVDWAIGIVPLVGDAFDVSWKANRRNVDLLKAHLETKRYQTDSKNRAMFI